MNDEKLVDRDVYFASARLCFSLLFSVYGGRFLLILWVLLGLLLGCVGSPSNWVIEPAPNKKPQMRPKEQLGGFVLSPLVIVRPEFPATAEKEKEGVWVKSNGWVHLAFAVDKQGDVKNIRQLGESPPNIFSSAARKSLANSKYFPPEVNGKSLWVNHVEMLYIFEHYGKGTVACEAARYGIFNPKKMIKDANINHYEFIVDPDLYQAYKGFRPATHYPSYALERNVKGEAIIGFSVSKQGVPEDVRVLEEFPMCMGFGKAAVNAIKKIKLESEAKTEVSYDGEYYVYHFKFNANRKRR